MFVLIRTSLDAQINRLRRILKINPLTGIGQVALERKRGAIMILKRCNLLRGKVILEERESTTLILRSIRENLKVVEVNLNCKGLSASINTSHNRHSSEMDMRRGST